MFDCCQLVKSMFDWSACCSSKPAKRRSGMASVHSHLEGKTCWGTIGGVSVAILLVTCLVFAHLCVVLVINMTTLPGTWFNLHDHRQLINTESFGFQFVLLSVCIAAFILLGDVVVRATCNWRKYVETHPRGSGPVGKRMRNASAFVGRRVRLRQSCIDVCYYV